ncbi:hypothetical protein TWF173_002654 [Orbilia oligospora]|nr:hypothetical protein TWF173_002654 [Orbilia oligospora]
MAAPIRPRCFLDLQYGTDPVGRVVIELFTDKTPKTCENFRSLCTASTSSSLHYKSSIFHRVIEEFMLQGGDITRGDGKGGVSIYGDTFEDENLGWCDIDKEGLVCMANRGKDTNSSQFFITCAPCDHLNGKHTVFGHVVSGLQFVKEMEKVRVDSSDKPVVDVIISNCGELEFRRAPAKAAATGTTDTKKSRDRKRQRSQSRSVEAEQEALEQNRIVTSGKREIQTLDSPVEGTGTGLVAHVHHGGTGTPQPRNPLSHFHKTRMLDPHLAHSLPKSQYLRQGNEIQGRQETTINRLAGHIPVLGRDLMTVTGVDGIMMTMSLTQRKNDGFNERKMRGSLIDGNRNTSGHTARLLDVMTDIQLIQANQRLNSRAVEV